MKIIKQPYAQWSFKFTCSDCTAELEADGDDLVKTHYDGDYRESAYDAWHVNCPVCGHATSVKESSIPKIVKINYNKSKSSGPYDR